MKYIESSKASHLANGEDPDDMQHDAAFHHGLHCLLRQNPYSEEIIPYFCEILTCDLSICTMDHCYFIVYNFMDTPLVLKGLRQISDYKKSIKCLQNNTFSVLNEFLDFLFHPNTSY